MRSQLKHLLLVAALLFIPSFSWAVSAFDALSADEPALPNETVVYVPVGDDHAILLQVTISVPDGPGPFPLAVFNHGSDGTIPPSKALRSHLTLPSLYFMSRGYAVVQPMMRGYAGSGGFLRLHVCDLARLGIDSARDIGAVIAYMIKQPYIDGSRIVVAGKSFGGWNTLALGTLNIPNVKGLISLSGGAREKHCLSSDESLIEGAGKFGAATKIPALWLFGDNDSIFPNSTWHRMFEHYVAKNPAAELVAYGSFMNDSHNLTGSWEGLPIWVPKLDAFLERIKLPNKIEFPYYMPVPVPPPSHYAAIDDVDSVPYMNSDGEKELYRQFLEHAVPRVFAIGATAASAAYEGFDPITGALRSCEKLSTNCHIYAVDSQVVWTRPTPAPPVSHYAEIMDVVAVPYIAGACHDIYKKFLSTKRPRAFVIAPDGGCSFASLGPDPIAFAMNACNKSHSNCQFYAIDGDVVWVKQSENSHQRGSITQ